mgnify:CR=1 FL=1
MLTSVMAGFVDEGRSSPSHGPVKPKAHEEDSPIDELDQGDDGDGSELSGRKIEGMHVTIPDVAARGSYSRSGPVVLDVFEMEFCPADGDFRNRLHGDECQCVDDETCIICVTQQDLLGISPKKYKVVDKKRAPDSAVLGNDYSIEMRRFDAELAGFL